MYLQVCMYVYEKPQVNNLKTKKNTNSFVRQYLEFDQVKVTYFINSCIQIQDQIQNSEI